MSETPRQTAVALGQRLRAIRLNLPPADGRTHVTQSEMALLLLVGGKGVVSLFESGRRLPSEQTLGRYADLGDVPSAELAAMRASALAAETEQAASVSTPPSEPQFRPESAAVVPSRQPWRKRPRLLALVLGCVLAAVALVTIWSNGEATTSHVSIDSPRGLVGPIVAVHGTVTGFDGDHLWLDEQAGDGDRHHPTEAPCQRSGNRFSFDTLYVGAPHDAGRRFHLRVVATRVGSVADRTLQRYARRPKNTPDAYVGLLELPDGARVVASTTLQRRG